MVLAVALTASATLHSAASTSTASGWAVSALHPATRPLDQHGIGIPLWTTATGFTPAAREFAELLHKAAAEGSYGGERERQVERMVRLGRFDGPGGRAGAEQMLSQSLVSFLRSRLPTDRSMTYVDPELAPAVRPTQISASLERGPGQLRALTRMNPLYEDLAADFAAYRMRWSSLPEVAIPPGPDLRPGLRDARIPLLRRRLGLTTSGDPLLFDASLADATRSFRAAHGLSVTAIVDQSARDALNAAPDVYQAIVRRNLDRLRAIPGNPGERYIVVDAAGARLWLIEGGQIRDTMRVIVGKQGMETPQLAAYIRFLVLNPYWNIPPDLVRDSIAPKVLAEGPGYVARHSLELLEDWRAGARVLAPEEVDWAAVAAGTQHVWVRQLPGGDNFMGKVKFMLPNRLGVYLHDTPNKATFDRADRRLSSGCVRVEDAARLAGWLMQGQQIPWSDMAPERRIDLAKPVPVFITYLTAVPEGGTVRFQRDVYRRDVPLTLPGTKR
jgi:murein L,D-transpeptidase YcbB/YkuD